eukprot:COSAG01_NODE_37227_length_506_cov_2.196560_1_plen_76_part_10
MHSRLLALAQAHGLPLGWHAPAQLSHCGLNGPWKHLHGPGALRNTARTHPTPHARPEGRNRVIVTIITASSRAFQR